MDAGLENRSEVAEVRTDAEPETKWPRKSQTMDDMRMHLIHPDGEGYFRDALELEDNKCYMEAATVYYLLVDALLHCARSVEERYREATEDFVRMCTDPYVERAKTMERKAEIAEDRLRKRPRPPIVIPEDAEGYGLMTVLGDYIDKGLTKVEIVDRDLNMEVFYKFCSSLLLCADNLKTIVLKIRARPEGCESFEDLENVLLDYGVTLEVKEDCGDLDHSEIRLDTGWAFKMPLGLDYFKKDNYDMDSYELDLRPCHAVTIQVYCTDPTPASDETRASLVIDDLRID